MIDPLIFSCSSQCSMNGVTKAVVCAIMSGMVHIKEPLLLIGKNGPYVDRFPLSLYEWSLQYVQCHITVLKMC